MDVLVEFGKPMLHERVDIGKLDVACSLEAPELIVVQNDVGNPLIILMWWTRLEVPSNDVLEVEVCIRDRVGKEVVDVLDVHQWWCEVGSIPLDVELREHHDDFVHVEVVQRFHLLWW